MDYKKVWEPFLPKGVPKTSSKGTKEEESDKEPNSPKLVEGSENPKPRVDLEEEPVKLSVELEYTTPMPTSSSTSRKLKLSILIDMWKFMNNQQQTYWKYAKIRDDLIGNTLISLTLLFLSSQMLSLRHRPKILIIQAEKELKKTRE
ncbi:hypothetical protein PVK06_011854 [Gossypium arboreum]|uniref:Uncharacterized protein n=1 Tax=Gossypium arboreum TaxID=29729 RepID=A0ABR0QAP0_GOSAR|nr:hypothetical protein PVK06_011854 [Gossypium arboreum]